MCGTGQSSEFTNKPRGDSPFMKFTRTKVKNTNNVGDIEVDTVNPNVSFGKTSTYAKIKTSTRDKNIYYAEQQVDMVDNENQKPAGTLDPKATRTLQQEQEDEPGFQKQMSRFQTVQGSRTHQAIKEVKTTTCTDVFGAKDWDKEKTRLSIGSGLWSDPEFTAEAKSIISGGKIVNQKLFEHLKERFDNVTWKRASEIDDKMQVIHQGIRPQDIVQGELHNAYFLSAVSAVAEYQARIRRLLLQKETSKNGAYGIALNRIGNWKIVTVDDNLPITKDKDGKQKLLGANSLDAELWVPLIEKAYAKLFRGYDKVGLGGDVGNALRTLTGAPSEKFPMDLFNGNEGGLQPSMTHNKSNRGGMNLAAGKSNLEMSQGLGASQGNMGDQGQQGGQQQGQQPGAENGSSDVLWELLKKADINRFIMVAGTKTMDKISEEYYEEYKAWKDGDDKKDDALFLTEKFGLYPGFCYTLLDIAEYNGERLVRLRNSKGILEWTGDWGDNSDKWKDIREEFRTEVKDDGIFYMPFVDFQSLFDFVEINYYDDSYTHSAFTDKYTKDTMSAYDINVSAPGEYFISLSQADLRSKSTAQYDNIGLFLVEQIGGKITYRGGLQSRKRENWIKCSLEPGNYTLFVKGYLAEHSIKIGLSVYGPGPATFRKTYAHDILKRIEIVLSKAFASKALQLDEEWGHLVPDRADPLYKAMTFFVPSSSDGYGFKIYRNSTNKPLIIEVEGTIQGGRLVFPVIKGLNESFKFAFEITPGYTQVLFWDVSDDVDVKISENAALKE